MRERQTVRREGPIMTWDMKSPLLLSHGASAQVLASTVTARLTALARGDAAAAVGAWLAGVAEEVAGAGGALLSACRTAGELAAVEAALRSAIAGWRRMPPPPPGAPDSAGSLQTFANSHYRRSYVSHVICAQDVIFTCRLIHFDESGKLSHLVLRKSAPNRPTACSYTWAQTSPSCSRRRAASSARRRPRPRLLRSMAAVTARVPARCPRHGRACASGFWGAACPSGTPSSRPPSCRSAATVSRTRTSSANLTCNVGRECGCHLRLDFERHVCLQHSAWSVIL